MFLLSEKNLFWLGQDACPPLLLTTLLTGADSCDHGDYFCNIGHRVVMGTLVKIGKVLSRL